MTTNTVPNTVPETVPIPIRSIIIGARRLNVDGFAFVRHAGWTEHPVYSGQREIGVVRRAVAPSIACTVRVESGTDLHEFELDHGDVRVKARDGSEFLMRDGFNLRPPEWSRGLMDVIYSGRNITGAADGVAA